MPRQDQELPKTANPVRLYDHDNELGKSYLGSFPVGQEIPGG